MTNFGISLRDYEAMLEAQGGGCAVCGAKSSGGRWESLPVDHCHETGKIRGILCLHCNTGLGHFSDDPARVRDALAYLERHAA